MLATVLAHRVYPNPRTWATSMLTPKHNLQLFLAEKAGEIFCYLQSRATHSHFALAISEIDAYATQNASGKTSPPKLATR